MSQRNLFVTTALPYANGAFHMGHIMEYIQADIWVRHERMSGNKVHFVGADDVHGAPIMIAAQKRGITPQAFVAEIAAGRKQYLDGFHISFDNWHSTDAVENHELSQDIYRRLVAAGLIYTKEIEQYYDTVKGMFLADRFIKGTCPRCGATDQYGDNCEKCSAVYSPMEVVNPYSTLSGSRPEIRKSTHYFFKLSDPQCVQFLRDWTNGKGKDGLPRVQQEVLAKDSEWLGKDGNLSDWDISRDEPYFGIAIPDAPGKYFYVWLDAPVGYLASLKNYCDKQGLDFEGILSDEKTEQIHFIGNYSLLIIAVSGLFVGFVLGLQGYYVLVTYGSEQALGTMVALSLVRELGPAVTALLFAGRAGTALTAEIGLMRAGEQLAAMEMMGVDPVRRVLAPRFIGAFVAMPVLATIFSAVGIMGAWFVGVEMIGTDGGAFWSQMQSAVDVWHDIGNGFIKSVVFGVAVALVALFNGYAARPTPEGVSRATTSTVVVASLLVLGLDFIMTAWMFTTV